VHRNKFLYNKTNQMHQFPIFTPAWNSTCFGQFLCPSSGVYSYTEQWYVIQVCRQLWSRTRMELQFHPGPAPKLSSNLYDIYHCSVYRE